MGFCTDDEYREFLGPVRSLDVCRFAPESNDQALVLH